MNVHSVCRKVETKAEQTGVGNVEFGRKKSVEWRDTDAPDGERQAPNCRPKGFAFDLIHAIGRWVNPEESYVSWVSQ